MVPDGGQSPEASLRAPHLRRSQAMPPEAHCLCSTPQCWGGCGRGQSYSSSPVPTIRQNILCNSRISTCQRLRLSPQNPFRRISPKIQERVGCVSSGWRLHHNLGTSPTSVPWSGVGGRFQDNHHLGEDRILSASAVCRSTENRGHS